MEIDDTLKVATKDMNVESLVCKRVAQEEIKGNSKSLEEERYKKKDKCNKERGI